MSSILPWPPHAEDTCLSSHPVARSGQWQRQRGYASFGRALNMVGAVASLYHASYGRLRPLLRKADYYGIAVASAMMRGAAIGGGSRSPLAVTLAMLAVLPFKPTLVTAGNLIAVEVGPARPHLNSSRPPACLHRPACMPLSPAASTAQPALTYARRSSTCPHLAHLARPPALLTQPSPPAS